MASESSLACVLRYIHQLAENPSERQRSDAELLQSFLDERDGMAFRHLMQRHGRMVLSVCRQVLRQREDAEDAFQAVFLILARKAASICKGSSLASWLHGVAFRTSLKARAKMSKRRRHEKQAAKAGFMQPDRDLALRELQTVLAEEVARLAEKYRAPFVLCCLEGMSRSEVAQQLGWKEGTVSGRLAEARKRLQARLQRRGFTLAAALCAVAVGASAEAAAPPLLIRTTIEAALRIAAGQAVKGVASAPVAALVEGATRVLFFSKVKLAVLVLAAAGLVAAAAGNRLHRVLSTVTEGESTSLPAMPALAAPAPAEPGAVIQVVTYYPGMPAAAVEKTITYRIERWVNQAPGVRTIASRSLTGVSIVLVSFRNDINADSALEITSQLALGTLPILPPNTLPPVVLPHSARAVGAVAVHGAAVVEGALADAAQIEVREWLSHIEGAVAPVVLGGRERVVHIYFDPKALQASRLSLEDVVKSMQRGKALAKPDNRYDLGENEITIYGTCLNLNDLKALAILGEGKQAVRLQDIGRIEDGYEPQSVRFRINDRPAVGVPVYASKGANPRTVVAKLSARLADLEKRMPEKIKIAWIHFGRTREGQGDESLLVLSVRAPSDTRLLETEKRVAAVERFLEKSIPMKERTAILSEVGMTPDWSAAHTLNSGPMDATVFVQLSSGSSLSAAEYAVKLRRLVREDRASADLDIRFASRDMPAPVDVRIRGENSDEAMRIAQRVRQRLAALKGAVDVDIAQRMDAPYLVITVNREKAAAAGLSGADVIKQAAAALKSGKERARNFWIENKSGDRVSIILPYSKDMKLESVLDIEAKGAGQKIPVKLSSLATLQRTTQAVEIDHESLRRVLDVRANIDERSRRDVIADIRKMLREVKVPEGIRVELVEEDALPWIR
jgi:RNA polymerase sigma factor (sigma-70 family)